jgi:OmcA/MtrC family decaheme c-type cytochrome
VKRFLAGTGTAEARRKVVDNALCNSCHLELSFHGSRGRRGVDYCLMCHGPMETNDERAPHPETGEVYVNSVDFRMMIHRIHRGTELSQPYVLGGNPPPDAATPLGVQHDFKTLEYPGRQGNCATCHIGATYMVPLPAGRVPSRDEVRECSTVSGDGYCPPADYLVKRTILHRPETAACIGCHDDPTTQAHADIMTTSDGRESCGACHGAGSLYDVARMHGLP